MTLSGLKKDITGRVPDQKVVHLGIDPVGRIIPSELELANSKV